MQKNLSVSKYRNGDDVSMVFEDEIWSSTLSGAYTFYNNDIANEALYAKLYSWFAVVDERGLCPAGWHIPSDVEWSILENSLEGNAVAGGKMKSIGDFETGSGVWFPPNEQASNLSGFNGLPGGYRYPSGQYFGLSIFGFWWSSTESSSDTAWGRYLSYDSSTIFPNVNHNNKRHAFSVRCIKD